MEKPTYQTLLEDHPEDVFPKVIAYANSLRERPISDRIDEDDTFVNSVALGWSVFNEDPDCKPVSMDEPFYSMITSVQENGWEQGIARVAELMGLDTAGQAVFLQIVKELGEVNEHRLPEDIFAKMEAAKAETAAYMAASYRDRDGYLIDIIDK